MQVTIENILLRHIQWYTAYMYNLCISPEF